jgi:NitT/TauT family transport system substrate-binding protein
VTGALPWKLVKMMSNATNRHAWHAGAVAGVVLAGAALVAACSSSGGSPGSNAGTTGGSGVAPVTLTMAYQAGIPAFAPEMILANDPSVCNQYNIRLKMSTLNPATAQSALVAGQIQALVQGSGSFLQGAYKDPGSVTIVGGTGPLPLGLFAGKSIASIADLKGKTVSASSLGSPSDLAMRVSLSEQGLEVGSNVRITYSASASAAFGLAESGAIAAFVYLPPLPKSVAQAGIHLLETLNGNPDVDALADSAIGVSTDFLKSHPDAMRGLLSCLTMAAAKAKSDTAGTAAVVSKFDGVDTSDAQLQVAASTGAFKIFPFNTSDAQRVISLMEKYKVQDFGNFDPSSVIDNSYLPK